MSNSELKQFIKLSRAIGRRPDFVQGTGGNISIKINNQKMLIKASGWRISDINENNGLVEVDINKIKDNKNFILEGPRNLKPSMESGFHVFLDKFVIHTHSVYINIISCIQGGEQLLREIFKDFDVSIVWLQYYNPGHNLALAVKKAVFENHKRHGRHLEVILLQNHGVIISGDDIKRVHNLHNEVQETIKTCLNLNNFPEVKISKTNSGFESQTDFLKNFINNNFNLIESLSKNILFPDQAVFCSSIGEKILINKANSDIIYKTSQKEALAIEENLTAWAYIVDNAKKHKFILNPLLQDDINYINNMESEKYRQQLLER